MAPAVDVGAPVDAIEGLKARAKQVDRSIFPDGLKTTG